MSELLLLSFLSLCFFWLLLHQCMSSVCLPVPIHILIMGMYAVLFWLWHKFYPICIYIEIYHIDYICIDRYIYRYVIYVSQILLAHLLLYQIFQTSFYQTHHIVSNMYVCTKTSTIHSFMNPFTSKHICLFTMIACMEIVRERMFLQHALDPGNL